MLFTSRNLKSGGLRTSNCNSKDSKGSKSSNVANKQQKIFPISQSQIRLREAINIKYEKSKIRFYKYSKISAGFDRQKTTFSDSSINSADIPEYANLQNQRFINLHEYHNKSPLKTPNKQYLIKFRKSQNKKTVNTQQNESLLLSKIYTQMQTKNELQQFKNKQTIKKNINFQGSFKPRKTLSGEKKQAQWRKLGFQYHSSSKNEHLLNKRAVSQMEQTKPRLFYFRKQHKSPSIKHTKNI